MSALELDGVCKTYGLKRVLTDVSLKVRKGEIMGLLGPNGAGKTTLLKIVEGLTKPTGGLVSVFGLDFARNRKQLLKQIGIVPQENNLEREATVREALILYARLFAVPEPRRAADVLLEKFGMNEWRDAEVRHLSGGMARKTLIVRALLPDPSLLLLDEPSVGLDPDVRRDIWRMIEELKRQGKTIIITTHYMEEAETLCDRIALLKAGRLLFLDTSDGLKRRVCGQTLEDAFILLTREEKI
jgi:ABC-type multidrug transport system ATPase subunit